ncbi:MAG: TetR/AcrR family transcriptional regulator [Proteobacteria bacterium]|nr:TetR/AcrR family transcriptional regulator [Pseudomonadota bacterium]
MAHKKREFSDSSPKKRTPQGESKKRLILKVATGVFAEKGFHETTIAQIAQIAKIAEGSIYHYFENKEDLLFSIPEERMENFFSSLREHLEGIKGTLSKLRKIIWYHLHFYEKNQDYVLILLQNIRLNPRFQSTRAYQLIREFAKLVAQIIEEGKKEKVIRSDVDSRLLRDAILGAIEHITIRGSILGRLSTLTEATKPLYDFFVSGIQTQSSMVTLPLREFLRPKKTFRKRIGRRSTKI